VASDISRSLTSGRLLARNTLWNLLGQGAPLLVAIVAIPILIHSLGTDRFGVLTLAWVIIGYFSLFDLGLGRALTQLVARRLAAQTHEGTPALVWTALVLMFGLGCLGALVLGSLSPWLVRQVLKIPTSLQDESLHAFLVLAVSIPVVITTAGLRGVLEAQQRFGLSNAVRIPSGFFTYLGPVLVLPFSKSLFWVVAVLMVGRVVIGLAYLVLCVRVMPSLQRVALDRLAVLPLFRFGGWMTVSNVVGPFMVYLDRFLIGALISISAVAYYATPYEMVTKLLVIPGALAGVLFPAFSTSFVQDRDRAALLLVRGVKYLFLVLFPCALLIITLAHPGLSVWLGTRFAEHSTRVLQWLAAGIFFNSLAQIPFALVQGAGRPDLTAKLHLIEVPVYVLALWWALGSFGIDGAAIAWMARAGIDMLVLFALAFRLIPVRRESLTRMTFALGLAIVVLAIAALPNSLALQAAWLVFALVGFALVGWFRILTPEERALGRRGLTLARVAN
jgi:O-antigen/teichoic acid export membrane protein